MTGPGRALSAEAIRAGLPTRSIGRRVVYQTSVTSTMDVATAEARRGAPEGTIVVADHQTQGRGRFQRAWVSPPGASVYLSIVLRPAPERLLALGIVASLAVARAVERETGLRPSIKWPNDVEIGGRKLAGILVDSVMKDAGVEFAIVGIGLNVTLDPSRHPEIAATATSLARELGRPADRLAVLRALLVELDALYDQTNAGQSLVAEWRARLSTLGRRVRVTWPGDPSSAEEGVAEDVDADGALLLRRDDATLARLIAGEVSLRG